MRSPHVLQAVRLTPKTECSGASAIGSSGSPDHVVDTARCADHLILWRRISGPTVIGRYIHLTSLVQCGYRRPPSVGEPRPPHPSALCSRCQLPFRKTDKWHCLPWNPLLGQNPRPSDWLSRPRNEPAFFALVATILKRNVPVALLQSHVWRTERTRRRTSGILAAHRTSPRYATGIRCPGCNRRCSAFSDSENLMTGYGRFASSGSGYRWG